MDTILSKVNQIEQLLLQQDIGYRAALERPDSEEKILMILEREGDETEDKHL